MRHSRAACNKSALSRLTRPLWIADVSENPERYDQNVRWLQNTLMACSHFSTSPGHSVVTGSDVGRIPNA